MFQLRIKTLASCCMVTDVCLDSPERKLVIECKYTPHVLQENRGKLSSRSEHLYQLFAYLKHLERRGGTHVHSEGILLYPTAARPVDFRFETQGHSIRVVTLDLQPAWEEIRSTLLNLLAEARPCLEGPGSVT